MPDPVVTIIVVTYKSSEVICDALDSARNAYESGLIECVVVDNASKDNINELIKSKHPWVNFIQSEVNLGYGRGCNQGLAVAKTPYIMFMNPDAVLSIEDLKILLQFMEEHPDAGMAAPAIIESDGEYQRAGSLPSPMSIIAKALGVKKNIWQHLPIVPGEESRKSEWICGAVLIARRELMNELEGFDPRFFLYFEETDLCKRVLMHGKEIWTVGEAVAKHIAGASAKQEDEPLFGGCIAEHYFPSRYYYLVKHHGYTLATLAEVCDLIVLASREIFRWIRGKNKGELRVRLSAPILRQPPRPADLPREHKS